MAALGWRLIASFLDRRWAERSAEGQAPGSPLCRAQGCGREREGRGHEDTSMFCTERHRRERHRREQDRLMQPLPAPPAAAVPDLTKQKTQCACTRLWGRLGAVTSVSTTGGLRVLETRSLSQSSPGHCRLTRRLWVCRDVGGGV